MTYPNDMSRIAGGLGKLEASSDQYSSHPRKAARNLIRHTFKLQKPAVDALAGDATAYTAADQIVMPRACKVLGVKFSPTAVTAADDTDYATLNVVKGDGLAGAETVIASGDTRAASLNALAAGVTETLTLSATEADTRIPAGGVLAFSIAKAGAGQLIGPGSFTVDVEWESLDGYGA